MSARTRDTTPPLVQLGGRPQARLSEALSCGLSTSGAWQGDRFVNVADNAQSTDGTIVENLEQLELSMNVIIEDFEEHIDKMIGVLTGKYAGGICPPVTRVKGLQIASRLNDLMERFNGLKAIIDETQAQAGAPGTLGKGVLQLDAALGEELDESARMALLRRGPPSGLSSSEIDAWYDGLVHTAKEAKKGLKKLKKQAEDNTSAPRTVTDGQMKIPMAIHDLYTRAIAFPTDDDSATYVRKGFWPNFVLENGYSGKPVDSADGFIGELQWLGKKYGNRVRVDITKFFEGSAGSWIPGRMAGTKIYTLVANVTAGKTSDVLVDVIFLVRDPKDDGEWKIKRIIHDGSFSVGKN